MRYGSVCSGIEAATQAWHPLGWEPAFFSEIEAFPSAVLAHHYPTVPNRGDMTKFREWPDHAIDLLVGGTPCQSFSVAGLRKGLADPRGNLMLTFGAVARRYRPRWIVWENVPGVLSSDGGRDFGAFLGMLAECGYGFAYRVLDAQYVRTCRHRGAVPQRRRRVFVVGCLGDWRRAAAVLFDGESLSGNPPPRREAGQSVAALTANGVGACGADDNQGQAGHLIVSTGDVAHRLNAGGMGRIDYETETMVAHTLRGDGFDASEDGSGRRTPLVPVAKTTCPSHLALGFTTSGYGAEVGDVASTMQASFDRLSNQVYGCIEPTWAVRRLTPNECHRLQGFPDGFCNIPWRGKDHAPDGPQYKALGNSFAVNVAEWIGRRIQMVEDMKDD